MHYMPRTEKAMTFIEMYPFSGHLNSLNSWDWLTEKVEQRYCDLESILDRIDDPPFPKGTQ
jgi:hypothetical protein